MTGSAAAPHESQAPEPQRGGCPWRTPFAADRLGSRSAALAYGATVYALFFATFCYTIGFVNNLLVPKSISSGAAGPVLPALLINGAFLAAFAVQHTVMARRWFKRWINKYIPESIERVNYVLATCVILVGMFAFWRPMPEVVWHVTDPVLSRALIAVSILGFGIALYSSILVNHFDLFGLRQVVLHFMGRERTPVKFQLRSLYRLVRHPLMVGFLIAFWSTPLMTVGHLFFAVMTTAYIVVGVAIEERSLVSDLGDRYRDYRKQVRGFIPLPVRSRDA